MLPRRRDAEHHSEFFDSTVKEDNSLDRNKRKTFYIEKSDNDDLSYRRTGKSPSNTVCKRHTKGLRDEKYFTDTPCPGKYSTHNCHLSSHFRTGKTASNSPKSHKQIVTVCSLDRKSRTSRQSRTDRKADKSDLSPRTHKRGVSLQQSPAQKYRINDPDKTVKIGRHGKNYRHFPSTDRTESLSPDRRKKTAWRPHEKNDCSESADSSSSSDSERESSVKVRLFKHILKPPKFDGVRSFESFWAQFSNCVKHNGWNRQQQLAYLRSSLEGEAASVLWDYGDEITGSLS